MKLSDRRKKKLRPKSSRDQRCTRQIAARAVRVFLAMMLLAGSLIPAWSQDAKRVAIKEERVADVEVAKIAAASPSVRIIAVPLPLTGVTDDRVVAQVEASVARLTKNHAMAGVRPSLILEFIAADGTAGEGTEFEAALKLARTLSSEKLSGVRTVAFLPSSVHGHAVLPVIACEEIIMSPAAELGSAGIDESSIGPLLRASYVEIASRRRTVPTALALGMLDRNLKLLKVQTLEGTRIVTDRELEELKRSTTVSSESTLKPEGEFANFSGADWRHELGYVSHLASDREQLAEVLKINLASLSDDPLAGAPVKAIRVDFDGPVKWRLVDRAKKIMDSRLKSSDVNLVILHIRSEGGSLKDAINMAQYLAFSIDHERVKTVAYVSTEAHGAAAIMALAADELVMEEGAVLGGPGSETHSEAQFREVQTSVADVMNKQGKAWSPVLALAGFSLPVKRYVHVRTNEQVYYNDEEFAARKDAEDWKAGMELTNFASGVNADEAMRDGLAEHSVRHFDEVKQLYRIEGDLPTARVNWALELIERLADRRISGILLFIGTFALFNELSQPGLGVPGFIAGVCFLLFFWSNFLHGNADVLELLLFCAGIVCVLLEVFVAPGTFIFGLGGAVMIVASIILASQTFVLPTNVYQMRQLPGSIMMVIGAAAGAVVGILVLQRFLPHTPYFKRLILQPPDEVEDGALSSREQFGSRAHLLGQTGIALTPLVPSGKVHIGDEVVDVVSEGLLIDPGSTVVVSDVYGNRVVVRPQ